MVFSEGRPMNLDNATDHPSFVMSTSFAKKLTGDQSGARSVSQLDGAILVSVGDFATGISTNLEYSGRP